MYPCLQAIQTFTAGMWQYPKDPDFPKLKTAAEAMYKSRKGDKVTLPRPTPSASKRTVSYYLSNT